VSPTRLQKRWSARLRTAGALLLLVGTVAGIDRLLPGATQSYGTLPAWTQLGIAGAALTVGGVCFWLGRRWR
jgi:hypothetical protein